MAWHVYVLRCSDGSYYTGHSDDLETRVAAHEQGKVDGYTALRRPVRLVFSETFSSRQDAFERERQIKGWSRKKKAALIRGDWPGLAELAQSRDPERPSTGSG